VTGFAAGAGDGAGALVGRAVGFLVGRGVGVRVGVRAGDNVGVGGAVGLTVTVGVMLGKAVKVGEATGEGETAATAAGRAGGVSASVGEAGRERAVAPGTTVGIGRGGSTQPASSKSATMEMPMYLYIMSEPPSAWAAGPISGAPCAKHSIICRGMANEPQNTPGIPNVGVYRTWIGGFSRFLGQQSRKLHRLKPRFRLHLKWVYSKLVMQHPDPSTRLRRARRTTSTAYCDPQPAPCVVEGCASG
jgi:hypothetical protein